MVTGGFFPVIDGDVLPRSTYEAVADGETAGIPVVVGTVRDEFSMFMLPDPGIAALNETSLLARVEAIAPGRGEEAIDLYRSERQVRGEDVSPPALWTAMMTDHDFFVPAMRFAELQSDHAPTYAYLFTYPSPAMGGAFGSLHGIDLPFVWGLNNEPGLVSLIGDLPAAQPLARAMQEALLAFARTGDPSTKALAWPSYAPLGRATMIFDRTSIVRDEPREAERQFWQRVART
jgi:para-nitrobenzyl esterase